MGGVNKKRNINLFFYLYLNKIFKMYHTLINLLTYCPYCDTNTHKLENCMSNDIIHFGLECYRMTITFQKINPANTKKSLYLWLTNHYILNSRLIYYYAIIRCKLSRRTKQTEREKIIMTIIKCLLKETEQEIIYFNEIPNVSNELYIIDNTPAECCICMKENISQMNMIKLLCNHEFCVDCLSTYINLDGAEKYCFLCREPITDIIIPS